jgi:tetratricopeptide (TPR) repeat protein
MTDSIERHPKVFCSHRGVDKPKVQEIAVKLRAAGIDAWVDAWEIGSGDDIVARINEGLETYDVGLLFLSKASLTSGWVNAEISTLIYGMIEEGKRVIPVMIEADAPIPPLLRPRARLGSEQIDQLIDAIYGRASKPPLGPVRSQIRERSFRIVLRTLGSKLLGVQAELDGKAVAAEQESRLDTDFHFSYQDFLRAVLPGGRALAVASAGVAALRSAALARLGDAVGRAVFPASIAAAFDPLLREPGGVVLSFETAEPRLLSIPFEAARLANGTVPALEPAVRLLRRYLGATAQPADPLPGPLRLLVAVAAPDEGKTKNAVLDGEAELQTILDALDQARSYGNAEVEILEVAHPDHIRDALEEQSFHVLHLSGHGQAGKIEMETEDGAPLPVTPKELVDAVRAAGRPLPLVFLSACHTAVAESDTQSFAQSLLEQGIPAVVAMQAAVSDRYATRLAGAFYGHLSLLEAPRASHALALARQEIETERRNEARAADPWGPEHATPALLLCAGAETSLLDRSLPQLQPLKRPPAAVAAGQVPILSRGDLIGRRPELREVLRQLQGKKAGVAILGIGGVGKSALAGRAMRRLADEGWISIAVSGRRSLGELALGVGAALLPVREDLAAPLLRPELPDEVRLQLLGNLLSSHRVLLVLDNFEDNLALGGSGFIDPTTGPVLESLCRAAGRGKLILTSRYPIPGFDAWLARLDLGPLSSAQTRKLFYRLESLKDQSPQSLNRVLRGIGGHPRLLEFLDAILRGGEGRLPIVEEKLRGIIAAQGLRIEDLGGDIDEAVGDAIRSGAKDILLNELLEIVGSVPGDRGILEQAAVFPLPIELDDLAAALAGDAEPSIEEIRKATERLVRTSLLTTLGESSVWVHRWTAEALKARMAQAEHRESCRRAGEALLHRADQRAHSLIDEIEAVRLLLQAEAYDCAVAVAGSVFRFMKSYGQASDVAAFSGEIVAKLPVGHSDFPGVLIIGADALTSLGDTASALEKTQQAVEILEKSNLREPGRVHLMRDLAVSYAKMGSLFLSLDQKSAKAFFEKDLAIAKRLAWQEPARADFQHDLSVSYERMGDILLSLGEGESAKTFFEESLAIRERLTQQEPVRADFQRDLSVACERMGDLFLSLGQRDSAKAFFRKALAIAKLLAWQEPDRTDFQSDLSGSCERVGDFFLSLGQKDSAKTFFEESLAIRERLTQQEPDRTDFQRDLSVSCEKLGDLFLSLDQGDFAKAFFEKSLAIRERLTRQEPYRTDFQRDLSVSYNIMGDLLLSLGQGDFAKAFFEKSLAISERLARQEPGRVDVQTDLVVSLVRMAGFDASEKGTVLNRALAILKALDARGGLAPTQRGWIEIVEKMLADSG